MCVGLLEKDIWYVSIHLSPIQTLALAPSTRGGIGAQLSGWICLVLRQNNDNDGALSL